MAKLKLIISLAVALLVAVSPLTAQAREFRKAGQKSEKQIKIKAEKPVKVEQSAQANADESVKVEKSAKAEAKAEKQTKTKKVKPVSADTDAAVAVAATATTTAVAATVVALPSQEKESKPAKTKKVSKAELGSSVTVAATGATTKSSYAVLQNEQMLLSEKISILSSEFQGASKSKARKISKQINDLTLQLTAVERRMDSYPESIRNPSSVTFAQIDDQFARELDAKVAARVAASNPYAGQLSSDPELEKIYRQALKSGKAEAGITYRVMISISKSVLPKSTFNGLTDIVEQRMANGNIAYYQGAYTSRDEAETACRKILAARKFRDAFVVAMQGDRRVELP